MTPTEVQVKAAMGRPMLNWVGGKYEWPAPEAKTTVALRITDVLGEELLASKEV